MSQSGVRFFDCCVRSFKVAYAKLRRSALSEACSSGVCIFERCICHLKEAYAFLVRFELLGFGFELWAFSKPSSQAHYSKLHYDRQNSIVIETKDSGFW
jgi:hypothetical protein